MRRWKLDPSEAAGRIVCAACGLALATSASAELAWQEARASGDASSRMSSASDSRIASSSATWYLCLPGETLRFSVAGAKTLRIEVRAVVDGSPNADRIRYTIALDDQPPARYARPLMVTDAPSTLERVRGELSSTFEGEVLLSETNVLVHEIDGSADMLRIWPHDMASGPLLIRVSSSDGTEAQNQEPASSTSSDRELSKPSAASTKPPASADQSETNRSVDRRSRPSRAKHELDGVVRVATGGHDSNPYLSPRTGAAAVGEAFWPGELELTYKGKLHPAFRLNARARTSATVYRAKILNESAHSLDLSQELRPRGRKGVRIKLEQRYRLSNSTFFGRGAVDEYSTTTDADETVSLADRFDYQDARIRARVRIPILDRVELVTLGWWLKRNYAEDYEEHADIDAIDYTRWSGSVHANVSLSPAWSLQGAWEEGRKDYREKFARNASAVAVDTVATRYSIRTLDAAVMRRPRAGLRLGATIEREMAEDRFEGYWDNETSGWSAEAGWKWRSGAKVLVRMRGSDTKYLNAHLDFDVAKPLKSKSAQRYELEAEIPLSAAWAWWLDFQHARHDNNNESFAYDQSVTLSGLEFRF